MARFEAALHPRDRLGRFIESLGRPEMVTPPYRDPRKKGKVKNAWVVPMRAGSIIQHETFDSEDEAREFYRLARGQGNNGIGLIEPRTPADLDRLEEDVRRRGRDMSETEWYLKTGALKRHGRAVPEAGSARGQRGGYFREEREGRQGIVNREPVPGEYVVRDRVKKSTYREKARADTFRGALAAKAYVEQTEGGDIRVDREMRGAPQWVTHKGWEVDPFGGEAALRALPEQSLRNLMMLRGMPAARRKDIKAELERRGKPATPGQEVKDTLAKYGLKVRGTANPAAGDYYAGLNRIENGPLRIPDPTDERVRLYARRGGKSVQISAMATEWNFDRRGDKWVFAGANTYGNHSFTDSGTPITDKRLLRELNRAARFGSSLPPRPRMGVGVVEGPHPVPRGARNPGMSSEEVGKWAARERRGRDLLDQLRAADDSEDDAEFERIRRKLTAMGYIVDGYPGSYTVFR